MTADEVDHFFAFGTRSLPAEPEWRHGNRAGERRSTLAVAVNGVVSPVTVELTVKLNEPEYLMVLMMVIKTPICRLCMTTGHRDRLSGRQINAAHFHGWEANRDGRKTIPKKLDAVEIVPASATGRDAALAWFINRTGIQIPDWMPAPWPSREGML